MKLETCTKCKAIKPRSEFYLSKQGWKIGPCKVCTNAATDKWKAANKEKARAIQQRWNRKAKAKKAEWYQKNKERVREQRKINARRHYHRAKSEGRPMWHQVNPAKALANCRRRQAGLKTASVAWRNDFFISEAYDLARRRTEMTGFAWHVDHIVPLKNAKVCGLHNEFNLAVIPGRDNILKSNISWPEMP